MARLSSARAERQQEVEAKAILRVWRGTTSETNQARADELTLTLTPTLTLTLTLTPTRPRPTTAESESACAIVRIAIVVKAIVSIATRVGSESVCAAPRS